MAARKKVEEVKVEESKIKYRSDFNSWEEYNKYTGLKG